MAVLFFSGCDVIQAHNISKRFGAKPVLEDVSFVVNDGERAGVVGVNGSGKTTLLDVLAGRVKPEGGRVELTAAARVGYLRQGYAGEADERVADVFPSAFAIVAERDRLEALARAIATETDARRGAALADEYAQALSAIESRTAADSGELWRALGLRDLAPDEHVGALSGGELTKLGLIDLALSRPDVLLLDEPTNNLDFAALSWLDEYVATFPGAAVFVSHDRALLDDHATSIIEIDAATHRAETFAGNYDDYAAERARREADLWARFRRQQDRERKVEREVRGIKATARGRERRSQNDFYRRKTKKLARRAVVLERRLRRELASEGRVDKPVRRPYRVHAEMEAERSGDRMLSADRIELGVDGRVLLRDASLRIGWGERVVLVGPNGSGKTTLLRALLGGHTPAAGAIVRSPSARIGYLPQSEAGALAHDAAATPVDVVRGAAALSETEARRFLHRFLFAGDDALTPISRLSYGERRRLDLARIVLSGASLLLLDEPTNHLDIPSREAFEAALEAYAGGMLAVTHDRYFIERFAQRILAIEGQTLMERY